MRQHQSHKSINKTVLAHYCRFPDSGPDIANFFTNRSSMYLTTSMKLRIAGLFSSLLGSEGLTGRINGLFSGGDLLRDVGAEVADKDQFGLGAGNTTPNTLDHK